MEDQEIRIGETNEMEGEIIAGASNSMHEQSMENSGISSGSGMSQTIIWKVYASVYDKRVWKRRLLVFTDMLLLVFKRPNDHYLKNRIVFREVGLAVAAPLKKSVC